MKKESDESKKGQMKNLLQGMVKRKELIVFTYNFQLLLPRCHLTMLRCYMLRCQIHSRAFYDIEIQGAARAAEGGECSPGTHHQEERAAARPGRQDAVLPQTL